MSYGDVALGVECALPQPLLNIHAPLPGDPGNSVIAGHRDTELAFLRQMKRGDVLIVERSDGNRINYCVIHLDVLDKNDTWVTKNEAPSRLTLITCWPFDALRAGGPGRYAVIAQKVERARP